MPWFKVSMMDNNSVKITRWVLADNAAHAIARAEKLRPAFRAIGVVNEEENLEKVLSGNNMLDNDFDDEIW